MAGASDYRVASPPRFAGLRAHDCARCGREEVKPVFLADPDGTHAYGSGCAARLLGYSSVARVRNEARAVQHAADTAARLAAERAEHAAAILAENPGIITGERLPLDNNGGHLYLAKKGEVWRYMGSPQDGITGFRPAFHAAIIETAHDGTVMIAERVRETLLGGG